MKPLKPGVYYCAILNELIVIYQHYRSTMYNKDNGAVTQELIADIETEFFGRLKEVMLTNTDGLSFVGKL